MNKLVIIFFTSVNIIFMCIRMVVKRTVTVNVGRIGIYKT